MKNDAAIKLNNVTKRFDDITVLNNISLHIDSGSFTTLLGPSGCGKTTLLRLIAGFYEADEGEILIGGRRMNGLPPHKRNTPFVFQDYALFPHKTVYQNVAYGLELRQEDRQRTKMQVMRFLQLLGLAELAERFPRQLSGGQQQRVALARALAVEAGILLLDEPLSNLDAKLRVEVRVELRRLQQELNTTNIYVTHDQDEALAISDVIVVMRQGIIQQVGSPQEIYFRPANQFVASFVGTANFMRATVCAISEHKVALRTAVASLAVNNNGYEVKPGQTVYLMIRPEALRLLARPAERTDNILSGRIKMTSFLGAKTRYWIESGGEEYIVDDADNKSRLCIGAEMALQIDGSKTFILSEARMEATLLA